MAVVERRKGFGFPSVDLGIRDSDNGGGRNRQKFREHHRSGTVTSLDLFRPARETSQEPSTVEGPVLGDAAAPLIYSPVIPLYPKKGWDRRGKKTIREWRKSRR